MSTLEDRLRAAFRADAETVRPEAIPGVPERPQRPCPACGCERSAWREENQTSCAGWPRWLP